MNLVHGNTSSVNECFLSHCRKEVPDGGECPVILSCLSKPWHGTKDIGMFRATFLTRISIESKMKIGSVTSNSRKRIPLEQAMAPHGVVPTKNSTQAGSKIEKLQNAEN